MSGAELVWGAADWLPVILFVTAVMFALLIWGYVRAPASRTVRFLAAALKAFGVAVLAACLLEPLFSGTRAQPRANVFVVLADNSQSMTLREADSSSSRGEQLKALLADKTPWSTRLAQDFDVRRYAFDSQLRPVADYADLALDGGTSALGASLERLIRRYQGRPLAGILLFSDGNATDARLLARLADADPALGQTIRRPAIYPVLIGGTRAANDIGLARVSTTQTSFEDAPVTVMAELAASGYRGKRIVAQLLDEAGKEVETQKLTVGDDGEPLAVRFQLRPERPGVSFYRVRAAAEEELRQFDEPAQTTEATLANNSQMVAIDRGEGPYRILYVGGRPNWEFKFLRRSLQEDSQVELVGLLRIAKREPKFDFRGRAGEGVNPLFRGFDPKDKEAVEQYDEPVIVRLGAEDEAELRGGFPKTAEELFRYHAVVLDDVEAEFFSPDQATLLKDFVRHRGGGLLMLGGQESFKNGRFDRTAIGELLPVYLDEVPTTPPGARFQLGLSREGWLAPWVRLRSEEQAERQRIGSMPPFQTLNQVRSVKPGATVLATATTDGAREAPALVEQRFGRGRVAALLIGDLWRWSLRRPPNAERDLEKAWRQAFRWLVSDVPERVEMEVDRGNDEDTDASDAATTLAVNVRDAEFSPLENATASVRITPPDGKAIELTAEPSDRKAGRYEASYVSQQTGAYRAEVTVTAEDGSEVGSAATGWTAEPAAQEFRNLSPNRDLLERLAEATGGELVQADHVDSFVATLPMRDVQITEPYVSPFWHQPWVFLVAIACLTAEWGLRRWKGLP